MGDRPRVSPLPPLVGEGWDGGASVLVRREVYSRYYSMARLRARAERYFADDRGTDLWQGLLTTFRLFEDGVVAAHLGLAPLNGELFGPSAIPDIEAAHCTNAQLLSAIRALSEFEDESRIRRRVNYAGLDVEELGSVYESLLEFQPRADAEQRTFAFAKGSERRQTGSYYTPPELVRELIDHALVPVMEERLAAAKTRDEKERALLALRVCDPASGSGHFLLAAARRLARELARIRTGEDEPSPEAYRHAVREVIRQCIYAVDKNPLAVDLCKVALWIESHEPGLPLSFLDLHVKCGDSLVGVADLSVLREGIPDSAYKRTEPAQKAIASSLAKQNKQERTGQRTLTEGTASDHLERIALAVEAIDRLADDSAQRVAEKSAQYIAARGEGSEWWTDTTACHLWTAPFFADFTRGRDLIPTTGAIRRYLANPRGANPQMVGLAWEEAVHSRFFHWALEFPSVMRSGGFDVILGNPPFMGGRRITELIGPRYSGYLGTAFAPAPGASDLCAHMLRRAFSVLRPSGRLGMVAVNTISQGDTREGGLALIVGSGGTITAARRFVRWPGTANVEVNLLAISKGSLAGSAFLDGAPVAAISSRLDDEAEAEPRRLRQNERKAFIGSYVLGMGFILEPEEAERLIAKNPRNRECLFPFLGGDDLNSQFDLSASRWAIQFDERSEIEAKNYPDLWRIVEQRVYPERSTKDAAKYPRMVNEWWKYWNNRRDLTEAIRGKQSVLTRTIHSELHMIARVPTAQVFQHGLVVFVMEDDSSFALLQSNLHEAWVWKHASSLESRNRYTPTDCFETFPFPQRPRDSDVREADRIGAEYYEHRRQTMLKRQLGLTKTYNLFHRPDCHEPDIEQLRALHAGMDEAILACYGWSDIKLGHALNRPG